jgi:hypothetical protein
MSFDMAKALGLDMSKVPKELLDVEGYMNSSKPQRTETEQFVEDLDK